MCQQSIQDTGDIGITASNTVYDFDIGVRRFFIIGIILGAVDNRTEGMTLRLCTIRCVDATMEIGYSSVKLFIMLSGIAFLQESQACGVLGAEEDIYIRQNGFDAFLRLSTGPQIAAEVHIEGDDGSPAP